MNQPNDTLDSFFENFEAMLSNGEGSDSTDRKAVTIWLPIDYKERFDSLQAKTKKKFGKKIKAILMKSIDLVDKKAS